MVHAARAGEGLTLSRLLREHLPGGGADLAVVEEAWPAYEHINVQAGLDAWLREPGRAHALVGVIGFQHRDFGLAELLGDDGQFGPGALRPGNVARANLPAGPDGAVLPCVRCGLYLVSDGERHSALLLRGAEPHSGHDTVTLQVLSAEANFAAQATSQIRALTVEHNVFRGQVLSFGDQTFGHGSRATRYT